MKTHCTLPIVLRMFLKPKFNVIFTSSLLFSIISFGQITVDSNGKVGIGTSATSPNSKFTVNSNGNSSVNTYFYSTLSGNGMVGLKSVQVPGGSTTTSAIIGEISSSSGGFILEGVQGNALRSSTTSNPTYGVHGIAGNGLAGYNYGVYGELLEERNGAAIFGSLYTETTLEGQYAGYFWGPVEVDGDLTVDGEFYESDINKKKDIIPFNPDEISKLQQLNVIKFKMKHPSELPNYVEDTADIERINEELNSERYTKVRIGLIAQELETTFPEVIKTGNDGYLVVNYQMLIPVLVEAIKVQQSQIEDLTSRLDAFQFDSNIKRGVSLASEPMTEANSTYLYQNNPNPFDQETIIQMSIPENIETSSLIIYNLQGVQIKSVEIIERGIVSVSIQASDLKPGTYLYTLITDGKEVSTKKMILTD